MTLLNDHYWQICACTRAPSLAVAQHAAVAIGQIQPIRAFRMMLTENGASNQDRDATMATWPGGLLAA
jgi:hypothetical protein